MSLQLLCPTCGSVAELHRPPVTECARCHSAFPEPLRLSAERTLLRERAQKPLLLTLGHWASLFTSAMMSLFLVLAPFNVGTFTIGDEVVSGPEFLRRGGWLFAMIGLLLLVIGVGLWREREWARPLMLFYWLSTLSVAFIGQPGTTDIVFMLLFSGTTMGTAAWYLYMKPNVRAFFDTRSAEHALRHDT